MSNSEFSNKHRLILPGSVKDRRVGRELQPFQKGADINPVVFFCNQRMHGLRSHFRAFEDAHLCNIAFRDIRKRELICKRFLLSELFEHLHRFVETLHAMAMNLGSHFRFGTGQIPNSENIISSFQISRYSQISKCPLRSVPEFSRISKSAKFLQNVIKIEH